MPRPKVHRSLYLGAFLLIGLAALTALTLLLSNALVGGRTWTAYFSDAADVREGVPVFVSGTKVGVVESVTLVSDPADLAAGRHVKMHLSLDEELVLWEGAEVRVVSQGLLGRAAVVVYRGKPGGAALDPDTPLRGSIPPGLFDDIGGVFQDNRADVRKIVANIAEVSERLKDGRGNAGLLFGEDDTLRRKIESAVDRIATAIESPDSSLGKFLTTAEAHDELVGAAKSLRALGDKVDKGEGLLPMLLNDKETRDQFRDGIADLREIARLLRTGDGPLSMLLNDTEVTQDLKVGIRALRRVAERIESGDGTFAKLLDDKRLYDNLEAASADFRAILKDIREGKGTIGKLLTDEGAYEELQRMLEGFRETGDVARENAPLASVITFTSLFFNVLN